MRSINLRVLFCIGRAAPSCAQVARASLIPPCERPAKMLGASIRWLLVALSLGLIFQPYNSACAASTKPAQISENSGNTIPLKATSTVVGCITVEAVLLSHKPAAMLFGGFVADNYAVVKTTVSNHCSGRQFILHNIYFDYRGWALSGVYASLNPCNSSQSETTLSYSQQKASEETPAPAVDSGTSSGSASGGSSTESVDSTTNTTLSSAQNCSNQCCSTAPADIYTSHSQAGQVATAGARDVEYQEEEDSEFSPRNKVVKALTLIGAVAQGYAFVGSGGAAMGIGAFNTAFVGSVVKLWPDRRIDQEKYLLSLGYRTDQSTAIAKEDHGSYYAFFPLATFLTPNLKDLFLNDPAVFLNPSEAWLEPGALDPANYVGTAASAESYRRKKKVDLAVIRSSLMTLVHAIPGNTATTPTPANLLVELSSPCPGENCPYHGDELKRVLAEKYLFKSASLNSVQIVARGVMTIPVESVPPRIDKVVFDNEKEPATWTVAPATASTQAGGRAVQPATKKAAGGAAADAANKPPAGGAAIPEAGQKILTGQITGKFLSGGTPSIVDITVPGENSPKLTDYILDKSLQVVKSSDSSLVFKLTLVKTLPSGTKLTFQVSRTAPDSTSDASTASSTDATSTKITSNEYAYIVSSGAVTATPKLSNVTMDNDSKVDVWGTAGKWAGTATGTDLTGGTIAVSSLEIDGKTATVLDYIGPIDPGSTTSSATSLDFRLTLLKPVKEGSKVTFVVSTKSGNTTLPSNGWVYTVTKPKTAAAKPPAKTAKPAAKPKPAK